MRLLVQRVLRASVEVDGFVEGRVGAGLVLSLCLRDGDGQDAAESLAVQALQLSLWPDLSDPSELWKTNVIDNGYEVLVTLQPSLGMGTPGDMQAAPDSEQSVELFNAFVKKLRADYQEEMIVAAPTDKDVTVEVTAEGHYMFDLDPDGQRLTRKRALEATTKVSMSGGAMQDLDPSVVGVTQALRRIPRLAKSKATLESCRVFRVLSQKSFQAELSHAEEIEADKFAEALEGAGAFFSKAQQLQIVKWTGMKMAPAGAAADGAEGAAEAEDDEEPGEDLDAQLAELQEQVRDPIGSWRRQKAKAKAGATVKRELGEPDEEELEHWDEEQEEPAARPRHHPDWKGRAAPDTSSAGRASQASMAARAWVQSRAGGQAPAAAPAARGGKASGKGKGPRPPRRGIGGIASLDHSAALHGTTPQKFQYGQLARYSDKELRFQQADGAAADEAWDEEAEPAAPKRPRRPAAPPKLPKGTPTVAPMCPETAPGEDL